MKKISFFVIISMTSIVTVFSQTGKENVNKPSYQKINSLKANEYKTQKAIKQRLDSITSNTNRDLYIYNNAGNVILQIFYRWNKQTNKWHICDKNEYEYDNNGNMIVYTHYGWTDAENPTKITNGDKCEITYNLNYSLSDLTIPDGSNGEYNWYSPNNMITEVKRYSWNDVTNDWDTPRIETYHYSTNDVAIIEITNEQKLQVYPNPTSDMLFIQSDSPIEQISFYDINGKTVKQMQTSNDSVSINDLSNGIYILKVKTSAGESTHKIIKK